MYFWCFINYSKISISEISNYIQRTAPYIKTKTRWIARYQTPAAGWPSHLVWLHSGLSTHWMGVILGCQTPPDAFSHWLTIGPPKTHSLLFSCGGSCLPNNGNLWGQKCKADPDQGQMLTQRCSSARATEAPNSHHGLKVGTSHTRETPKKCFSPPLNSPYVHSVEN